jgi:hypothetical protein
MGIQIQPLLANGEETDEVLLLIDIFRIHFSSFETDKYV